MHDILVFIASAYNTTHANLFQLNCYILNPTAINHTEAHRPSFALLLLPPAHVHYSRVAKQKER